MSSKEMSNVQRALRPRRSCLAVPGSSPKMMAKACSLKADQVFLDLEDAVAPGAKSSARDQVIEALRSHDWGEKIVVVRVNSVDSPWVVDDVQAIVMEAGDRLDCLMVPKVEHAHHVHFVANLLRICEYKAQLSRPIGLEIQIETATGLANLLDIANCSNRIETLIFGPADMSASLGLPTVSAGVPIEGYPGDHFHAVLVSILVAARQAGLQVIDGPYLRIYDLEGLEVVSRRSRALGYDGKWALHPDQLEVLNRVYSPEQAEFDRACEILSVYERVTTQEQMGAVMLGNEMIDEASRKMAQQLVQRGVRAGMKAPVAQP
jgi:citrate lyase subunit beta / citryl-CoA lyase